MLINNRSIICCNCWFKIVERRKTRYIVTSSQTWSIQIGLWYQKKIVGGVCWSKRKESYCTKESNDTVLISKKNRSSEVWIRQEKDFASKSFVRKTNLKVEMNVMTLNLWVVKMKDLLGITDNLLLGDKRRWCIW